MLKVKLKELEENFSSPMLNLNRRWLPRTVLTSRS